MAQSTSRFDERRRLLQLLGALPAAAVLAGLQGCGGGGDAPQATVTDRRVSVSSDVMLHVRNWQTAPIRQVIVLLAGLGATAHCFDSLAPALARHARVLAVSRRGYGQSDKPLPSATQRYDPATLVADLLALLDAQGIDRVVLAGHSIASNELTLFAGLHPRRVRGLVYLDTTFDYTQPVPRDGEPPPDNPALEEPQPAPADGASLAAAIAFAKRVNKNWFPAQEANLRDTLELSPDGSARQRLNIDNSNHSDFSSSTRAKWCARSSRCAGAKDRVRSHIKLFTFQHWWFFNRFPQRNICHNDFFHAKTFLSFRE